MQSIYKDLAYRLLNLYFSPNRADAVKLAQKIDAARLLNLIKSQLFDPGSKPNLFLLFLLLLPNLYSPQRNFFFPAYPRLTLPNRPTARAETILGDFIDANNFVLSDGHLMSDDATFNFYLSCLSVGKDDPKTQKIN